MNTLKEKVCAKHGGDPLPIGEFPIRKRSRRISRLSPAREVVFEPDSWCSLCRAKAQKERRRKKV